MQSPTRSALFAALLGSLLLAPAQAQDPAEQAPKTERKRRQNKRKTKRASALKLGQSVDAKVSLPTLSGKKLSFGDLRGKVVFVHWWSIRCPWEKYAEPVIVDLEAKYKGKPVVVLGINSNQNEIGANPAAKRKKKRKEGGQEGHDKREHKGDGEHNGDGEHQGEHGDKGQDKGEKKPAVSPQYAKLIAHIKNTKGFDHEVMIDHGNKVSRLFGARTTPHCFVIDQKGVLRYSGALDGYRENRDDPTPFVANAIDALLEGKEVRVNSTRPYG